MKKHLLCTSAIALGVAAAPVMAQDWTVGVGGYYDTHVGISDNGGTAFSTGIFAGGLGDFDGMEIVTDAEVHITPSITLDNGLTFGANIQMETADGADMDEVYVTVSSDTFGTLDIGSENSAGYKLMWRAGTPSVGGVPINSGSMSGFVPFATSSTNTSTTSVAIVNSFVQAGISQATEVFGNSDIQRISYYTPDFNGLTVGVSYAPDSNGGDGVSAIGNRSVTGVALTDVWDLGVAYSQSFGTADIALAARYGTGDTNAGQVLFTAGPLVGVVPVSNPETWGVAATVTVGAFAFGGHYAENDNGLTAGVGDQEGWGLGASYDMAGPWSFGIEYFAGEASHGAGNDKDEYEALKLAANRNLGPGVNMGISLINTQVDAADAALGGALGGATGTDLDAWTLATTLNLSF